MICAQQQHVIQKLCIGCCLNFFLKKLGLNKRSNFLLGLWVVRIIVDVEGDVKIEFHISPENDEL